MPVAARSETLWLAAYYLSRRTASDGKPPVALGESHWNKAYDLFYRVAGDGRTEAEHRNTLKNARDGFDGYMPNKRTGWRSADGQPMPLGTVAKLVFDAWQAKADVELETFIAELLAARRGDGHGLADGVLITSVPLPRKGAVLSAATPANQWPSGEGRRRSAESKRIGDRAELIVKRLLEETLVADERDTIIHHAAIGHTPGYDLSYRSDGQLIAVEVKGTREERIDSFELTVNELRAATEMESRFHLYLVAAVDTESPMVQVICGPLSDCLDLTPMGYRATYRHDVSRSIEVGAT